MSDEDIVKQNFDAGVKAYQQGDYKTAWNKFHLAPNHAGAQYHLGVMCEKGQGDVEQNHATALEWWRKAAEGFRRAAEQGDADAQNDLGYMYTHGEGMKKDDAEALKLFRQAAKKGSAEAQTNLGVMYSMGDGVLRNYQIAHVWFNIASVNGNERAKEVMNKVEKHLSPDAILEAQRIAKQCMKSNYRDCPGLE